MPQRFLRPGITTSQPWNDCSFEAQSLFIRLLTVVDDYGRYDGRAAVIRGQCFPLREDVTSQRIEQLLDELNERGMTEIYTVDDKLYVRLLKWQERARGASKYPSPPDEQGHGEPVGSIYFIQAGETGKVKIGFTQFKPEERLRRLQSGSSERLRLLYVISGTLKQEREIHRKFTSDNVGGEWFTLSEELSKYMSPSETRRKSTQPAGRPRISRLPSPSPSPSPIDHRSSGLRYPADAGDDFKGLFTKWIDFRKGLGKKPKDWQAAFQEQLDWIGKQPKGDWNEIISQSIRNIWQGLFALKGQQNGAHRKNTVQSSRTYGTSNESAISSYEGVGKV